MPHYFVPMLVEELTNLLRLGIISLPQGRWVYANPADTPYSTETAFFTTLKAITPTFEDTISIVIVEFTRCASGIAGQHILAEFSFTAAVATYALTHHDRELLNTRLSPAAKLATRLLIDESAIQSWKQGLFATRSRYGVQALLMIYQGKTPAPVDERLLKPDALLKALALRQQNYVSPVSDGSYLDNLVCYSRSGPIPNTDVGLLHDCAHILTYVLNRKPDSFGVKEAIKHHTTAQSPLAVMANDLDAKGIARQFDQHANLPGALVSSLVFLKLSHEIREHNQSLNREWLRELLSPIHDQASVARGVWWCGGFWGFTPFAEEYYAIASLPETPEPRFPDNPPAPPARAPDAPDSTIGESVAAADAATPEAPLVATTVEPVQETPQVIDVTAEPIPGSASVAPKPTASAPEVSTEPEQPATETPAASPDETANTAGAAEPVVTAGTADPVPVQPNPAPAAPPADPGSTSDLLGSEVPASKPSGKATSTRKKPASSKPKRSPESNPTTRNPQK